MKDKLPRLNYVTMLDSMLQVREIGDEKLAKTLFEHVWGAYDNMSDEEQMWCNNQQINWNERDQRKKVIEAIYAEDQPEEQVL